VYAVNPQVVGRYRGRHGSSPAKSDRGDAKVLADLVRTDRHNHRQVAGDSPLAEAVKLLARAHQSLIWNHGRLKALRLMRGLKQDRSARVIIAGHAFVQNLWRGHDELATDEPANRWVAVASPSWP
jgi:Transposase